MCSSAERSRPPFALDGQVVDEREQRRHQTVAARPQRLGRRAVRAARRLRRAALEGCGWHGVRSHSSRASHRCGGRRTPRRPPARRARGPRPSRAPAPSGARPRELRPLPADPAVPRSSRRRTDRRASRHLLAHRGADALVERSARRAPSRAASSAACGSRGRAAPGLHRTRSTARSASARAVVYSDAAGARRGPAGRPPARDRRRARVSRPAASRSPEPALVHERQGRRAAIPPRERRARLPRGRRGRSPGRLLAGSYEVPTSARPCQGTRNRKRPSLRPHREREIDRPPQRPRLRARSCGRRRLPAAAARDERLAHGPAAFTTTRAEARASGPRAGRAAPLLHSRRGRSSSSASTWLRDPRPGLRRGVDGSRAAGARARAPGRRARTPHPSGRGSRGPAAAGAPRRPRRCGRRGSSAWVQAAVSVAGERVGRGRAPARALRVSGRRPGRAPGTRSGATAARRSAERAALARRLPQRGDVEALQVAHPAVDRLEAVPRVPAPKSSRSTSATERPRSAASQATAAPSIPAPTTSEIPLARRERFELALHAWPAGAAVREAQGHHRSRRRRPRAGRGAPAPPRRRPSSRVQVLGWCTSAAPRAAHFRRARPTRPRVSTRPSVKRKRASPPRASISRCSKPPPG